MRFSVALSALSLLASFAAAQNIPACALNCLSKAPAGSCKQDDAKCLCVNQEFITSILACIATDCQGSDQEVAKNVALQLCQQAGVSLTLSSSGSATGSATSPASSAAAATSPAASSSSNKNGDSIASVNVAAIAGVAGAALGALIL